MDDIAVKKEIQRLKRLLKRGNVSKQDQDALTPLINNLAWQKIKLDDTREEIADASVIVKYDNGGGQRGTKENPLFKGYENLWRAYMQGLATFTSYLPKDVIEDIKKSNAPSALEIVRSMKGNGKD